MECRDAQFYLRFRRAGTDDLDADVSAALDQHVAACPQCAADAASARAFDAAVSKAMRQVPALPQRWGRVQTDALAGIVVTTLLRHNPPPVLAADNSLGAVLDVLFDPDRPTVRMDDLLAVTRMSERTMRRHIVLFDFLKRAVHNGGTWAHPDEKTRQRLFVEALDEWFPTVEY